VQTRRIEGGHKIREELLNMPWVAEGSLERLGGGYAFPGQMLLGCNKEPFFSLLCLSVLLYT
jgi:hypothetical protein